jgi:hypothetical protein
MGFTAPRRLSAGDAHGAKSLAYLLLNVLQQPSLWFRFDVLRTTTLE